MADQPVPCRYIDRAGRRNELDGAAEPTDPNVSDLDRVEEGNSAPMKHKAEVIGTSAKSAQTASADPTTITCHAMESASVALSRPETFGERLHWADRRRRRDPRSGCSAGDAARALVGASKRQSQGHPRAMSTPP